MSYADYLVGRALALERCDLDAKIDARCDYLSREAIALLEIDPDHAVENAEQIIRIRIHQARRRANQA